MQLSHSFQAILLAACSLPLSEMFRLVYRPLGQTLLNLAALSSLFWLASGSCRSLNQVLSRRSWVSSSWSDGVTLLESSIESSYSFVPQNLQHSHHQSQSSLEHRWSNSKAAQITSFVSTNRNFYSDLRKIILFHVNSCRVEVKSSSLFLFLDQKYQSVLKVILFKNISTLIWLTWLSFICSIIIKHKEMDVEINAGAAQQKVTA